MKPERQDIQRIILRAMKTLSDEERRAVDAYLPEGIRAFLSVMDVLVPEPTEHTAEADVTKLTCPHCGESDPESFRVFYDDFATRYVAFEEDKLGRSPPKAHVHAIDSTYGHEDGFTVEYLFLWCESCDRETKVPKWVAKHVEFY